MPRAQGRGAAVALAVLAGLLEGACFPPLGVWPLAFVALAPLLIAVDGRRAAGRCGLGWLAGTVAASLATTPWLAAAARDYFVPGAVESVLLGSLVGQIFHALPAALFALAAGRLQRLPSSAARVVTIAAAWTAFELLRSRMLTGAPWDLLAHALYAQPHWIQIADGGGAFAVSFVLAATSAAAAELARAWMTGAGGARPVEQSDGVTTHDASPEPLRGWRAARAGVGTALALLAVTLAYGTFRLSAERDDGPTLAVGVVQGNVPNAWRVDAKQASAALDVMLEATRPILAERPRLVVWPENATSFLVAPDERLTREVAHTLGPDGPLLLLGGPRYEQREPGRVRFYNAVYLLGPDGGVRATYDKRRLVPFGEYTPLPRIPALGLGFASPGDYTPGDRPGLFSEPVPFGVLVCFEAIYPELAREVTNAGARFLVNVSNDAWFGTTTGLEQHFAISVFRAVETRRALVRATNTGVTALVGPSGRIAVRFPPERRDAWMLAVPLREGGSPYARLGDAFAWLAVVVAGLGLALAPGGRSRARA